MLKRILLTPASWIYRMVIAIRHRMFDADILHSRKFDVPIICIGNLTVGGTGKTPFAEMLLAHFRDHYHPALLSRGYGRITRGYQEVETGSSYRKVGDEPKQIKLKYPDVVVVVCEDRVQGIEEILRRHPEVDLILMDDGFQHRYVEPKINIVLIDYNRPLSEDRMLPAGTLRDLPSQLHRAHYVCMTKCPAGINPLDRRIIKKDLGLYPYQSLFYTRIVNGTVRPIFPDDAPEKVPAGSPVIAMAAIGNPNPFLESLSSRFEVVGRLFFRDHHPYRVSDLKKMKVLLDRAPQGTVIVTTEKDAVKLNGANKIPKEIRERLYFLPIHISFIENSKENFLHKLEYDVRTNQTNRLFYPR